MWNPRFAAYAATQGRTPEEAVKHDDWESFSEEYAEHYASMHGT